MERRKFLVKAGGVLVAAGAATVVDAPNVIAQPRFQWRLSTSWPPKFPPLHDIAEMVAKTVELGTHGRFKIEVFGGGELIPSLENFDAARQGTIEVGHSAAYYWAGKEPATQWFTTVPFGLNAQGTTAWIESGGGQQLYDEVYSAFNLVGRRGGPTGIQMGGWFRRKIRTIDDYKGLKMRIPGLGGKVVARAGGTVVLLAVGDIFPSLERGVIDATEWVGPFQDLRAGFYQAVKDYYYPGWHEPGTASEFFFNLKAFNKLPAEYKRIVFAACAEADRWSLAFHDAENSTALNELINKHGVKLHRFPDPVLAALRKMSDEVVREQGESTPMAKKVNESYQKFLKPWLAYSKLSERAYYNMMFA